MDYEKKYKEALERAKKLYEQGTITESLSNVFPELIESENERIRKELIKYLKEGVEGYIPAGDRSDYQRWLAWLEKQGDQESFIDDLEMTLLVSEEGYLRENIEKLIKEFKNDTRRKE